MAWLTGLLFFWCGQGWGLPLRHVGVPRPGPEPAPLQGLEPLLDPEPAAPQGNPGLLMLETSLALCKSS